MVAFSSPCWVDPRAFGSWDSCGASFCKKQPTFTRRSFQSFLWSSWEDSYPFHSRHPLSFLWHPLLIRCLWICWNKHPMRLDGLHVAGGDIVPLAQSSKKHFMQGCVDGKTLKIWARNMWTSEHMWTYGNGATTVLRIILKLSDANLIDIPCMKLLRWFGHAGFFQCCWTQHHQRPVGNRQFMARGIGALVDGHQMCFQLPLWLLKHQEASPNDIDIAVAKVTKESKDRFFSRTCRKWNNFDIMISSENLRNSESPSSTILRSKVFSQIWKTQRISASVWVDLKQGAKVVLSAHGMKHRIW